jgi:hypothetical protein
MTMSFAYQAIHSVNNKFVSLINLIERLGVQKMKHFNHRGMGSIREMMITIGDVIQEDLVLQELRDAKTFGRLWQIRCIFINCGFSFFNFPATPFFAIITDAPSVYKLPNFLLSRPNESILL